MLTIKLLVMDVDGTMTDGSINVSCTGELFKVFNVKDGYGIKLAHEQGIITAIITGRDSEITKRRADELHINFIFQGVINKRETLIELARNTNIDLQDVAYIGDDLNDIDAMRCVGLSFCPSDAVGPVKSEASVVLSASGGHGAVRECVDYILALE